MALRVLSAAEAESVAVSALGLDEYALDLGSTEGISASLRRAASFMCPATPRQLVDAVLGAVRPLLNAATPSRDDLMEHLDLLIASGDLLELRREFDRTTRLLFLGPPSFIEREPGRYILLGVRPFGAPLVGSELSTQIQYERHTRMIQLPNDTARSQLSGLGFNEITRDRWIGHPRTTTAIDLVTRLGERLTLSGDSGGVSGLLILDPRRPVQYYRGRWREPVTGDTGDYVGRRPQAYGADLWCYVRLLDGAPEKLIDLPLDDPSTPGRDEAWRLQAAIDATLGLHQLYRARPSSGPESDQIVDFFSPVPGWVERYLELVGLPVEHSMGALFSWRVSTAAISGLAELLTGMLWMQIVPEGETV